MNHFLTSFTVVLLFLNQGLSSDNGSPNDQLKDEVSDDRIKSVQIYKEGWSLSYPVIKLNSDEKLVLDFDLLGNDPESYYYTYIHCDRDWKESSVFQSDYINGQTEDQIENYKSSFNTKTNYIHYKLTFPNDRMSLLLSGNYIIKVYTQGNQEKPVMTKRFMITEESAAIKANAHRPALTDSYNTGQQVDFTVNFAGIRVNDPSRDISSVVLQNGKWFDAMFDLKPDLVGNDELRYNSLLVKNIFSGGNEYRSFDTKSLYYQTEFIRKIDFTDEKYQIFLVPSENREFKPYFYQKDLNGKYYVAIKEGKNMDTDADYVYIYFTLPSINKVEGGEMYVSGDLANWAFTATNKMIFNQDKHQYECSMLLKQGWYNYEYIFVKNGETSGEPSVFEGNHYETENDYLILVYYRSPKDRYDRIIATTVAKSSKQDSN